MLFTFVGGEGHFAPLVPLARAARYAGHELLFGCAPAMARLVEEAGFSAHHLGSAARSDAKRIPLRPLDRAREERDLRERFARRAARDRVPQVIDLCNGWNPDVLVCDETDFGAMIAAERLGVPFATVVVIAAGAFIRADVVGEALDAVRAEHGLPPDPGLTMWSRHLVLSPVPPIFRDPADPLPATTRSYRAHPPPGLPVRKPPWASALPGAPTVYFTLGTVFNMESGDLIARVLEGLGGQLLNLVVTVGRSIDPLEVGPQPRNVHIERSIPQEEILAHCDLVVCHGGSGTVLASLAQGLPLVLFPMGADQPLNAQRCRALGVAEILDAVAATPARVASSVFSVLGDASYRSRAARVSEAAAALPELSAAIGWIEALARRRDR